ncbi:amidohydrolase [Indiicoccus explosivorum]|uniref:amidohydrolase n=1 Tax=Indiicoccus explosivorum TaxID=1917864 RepID=UPI000B44E074|nr:amidohydrolase [Indiicoccus explosivorum]
MTTIRNVRLYRPDRQDNPAERYAVSLNGDTIERIMPDSEAPAGESYDGRGLTLAPSFADSHMHLLRFGLMKHELDLRLVRTWSEVKQLVRDEYNLKKMEHGDWIVGRGIMDDEFTDIDAPLTAADLDELSHERPIFFLHDDGHECLVNSTALELIKRKDHLTELPAEFIETDGEGNWTGRFKDSAVHFIHRHFRQKTKTEVKEALADAMPHLMKNGITSVHTDDLNFCGSYRTLWEAYTELEGEGRLPIDVHLHHYIFTIGDLRSFLEDWTLRTGEGTRRVKVGAVKIFLDGTQRLHTGALREPYADRPDTRGVLNYPPDTVKEVVALADRNRMQVAMHAIGDRAVDEALDAIEFAGDNRLRHRIIHAQTLAEDQFGRLARVRPYVEIQPGFMFREWKGTAKWAGKEREPLCNAWGSLERAGIPFTTSSDTPIGPLSPILEIFAGVNRTDPQGNPKGGWIPEEKVGFDPLYRGYTTAPAELEFREHDKGRLEEGYQADLVLLSRHPADVSDFGIKELDVLETWSHGKQVYAQDFLKT